MVRSAMTMGTGGKIAEHLSVGVLAQIYPWERVSAVLQQTNRASERVRDLPAEVVTYYVMGLGLFMAVSTREVLRVLVEGLQWLGGESSVKAASKAATSQARTRLGVAPLKRLWEQTAQPLLPAGSAGAFFGARRLVALDGTTLDVPDTKANATHFGKPGASRGRRFPRCAWSAWWKPARMQCWRWRWRHIRPANLAHNGFQTGDPVIDLTGHYPTLLHIIGASPIGLAWLPGGYGGSEAFTKTGLDRVPRADLQRAWVLSEPEGFRRFSPGLLQPYGLDLARDYDEVGTVDSPVAAYSRSFKQHILKPRHPRLANGQSTPP